MTGVWPPCPRARHARQGTGEVRSALAGDVPETRRVAPVHPNRRGRLPGAVFGLAVDSLEGRGRPVWMWLAGGVFMVGRGGRANKRTRGDECSRGVQRGLYLASYVCPFARAFHPARRIPTQCFDPLSLRDPRYRPSPSHPPISTLPFPPILPTSRTPDANPPKA